MKDVIKKVLGCMITLCLIISAAQYVGNFLDPKWASAAMNAIDAFHSIDEPIDVLIYGSSHAWKGCDPMAMYQNYGVGAYNYGGNWQAINTTLLFLQDSLRTQSPKIACVETFRVAELEQNTNMDGEIYYTKAIGDFEGKREYLKQCFGGSKIRLLSYYMPILAFHDNWNVIERENFVDNRTVEDYVRFMGYESGTGNETAQIGDCSLFKQEKLPEDAIAVLDKMVKACEEKGTNIIFFTTPYEGEYSYSEEMKRYAAEHNCVYLNLFEYLDEMEINGETDFRDSGHLNDSGASKVADFMGKYIVENYDVADMRTVKGNKWELNCYE